MELIIWIILCILVGVYAHSKGRSGIGFFFISFLLSPLIGLIIALIVNTRLQEGKTKQCPYCAELIKEEAKICKHCQKSQEEVFNTNQVI